MILVQSLASREDSSVVRYNLRSRGRAVLSGMERDVSEVPEQLETYRSQLAIASQQVKERLNASAFCTELKPP